MAGILFLFNPTQPVVVAHFPFGEIDGVYLDRGGFQYTGLLALATACTGIGMHDRLENCVLIGSFVVAQVQRDRFIDEWANAVAHIAAQPQEVEAGLLVNQYRQSHAGFFDVRKPMVQRTGWAGFHARYVLAHFAGAHAGHKERRARRDRLTRSGQMKDAGRAVPDTQTTAHAGTQEGVLGPRPRWSQSLGWQGLGLVYRQPKSQTQHTDATTHARSVEHECPPLRSADFCGVVHMVAENWGAAHLYMCAAFVSNSIRL